MLKVLFDWSVVIALVIAVVHFVFPELGAAVGRSISNRFAMRSRAKTEKRIRKLQEKLVRVEQLPILDHYQDAVVSVLLDVMTLVMIVGGMVMYLFILHYGPVRMAHLRELQNDNWSDWLFVILSVLLVVIGIGRSQYLKRFRSDHSLKYKELLKKNIEELQARLT